MRYGALRLPQIKWGSRLFILAFISLLYGPVIRVPFLFDDHQVIERNTDLLHWSWSTLARDFHPTPESPWGTAYYRPVESLSHRIDMTLWGMDPRGHHLTNLIFHVLTAWLVMEIGFLLGLKEIACVLSGILFGAHPMIVSELLMVSGRSEILSFFFSLLAAILFCREKKLAILAGSLTFGAALLSKESALATPFFVILLLWTTGHTKKILPRIGILAVILGMYFLLRFHMVGQAGLEISSKMPQFLLTQFPLVLMRFVALFIFPWPLYLYRQLPSPNLLLGLLTIGGGIAGYALWIRHKRWLAFGVLWFVAAWIPKIPLMASGCFMLDHWAYPAIAGLIWPLAQALTLSPSGRSVLFSKRAQALLGTALLLLWSGSARLHIILRNSDEKNYRWSLRFTRAVPLYVNLGLIDLNAGRPAEALSYIEPALRIFPDDPAIRAAYEAAQKACHSPKG
ncbi:MAG: hypothetical protein WC859_00855 [Elusimicrobiota bacterium]